MILRSTTADSYFESDREARVMLQREHAAARRFVKRQAAAIDALTEVLFEKKSVDDSEISVRISQSPRSACLIAHTRPAKGLLRPEGRIPSDCYPDCLRIPIPHTHGRETDTFFYLSQAVMAQHAVPEPEDEEGFVSPESRERLAPWTEAMPEGSVPATNEWIET
jgi:hypothetical protein